MLNQGEQVLKGNTTEGSAGKIMLKRQGTSGSSPEGREEVDFETLEGLFQSSESGFIFDFRFASSASRF